MRFLESGKVVDLAGTDDAHWPFWSPDARQIAFHQNGMLRRVNVETGTGDTICSTPPFAGGSWNKIGSILLGDFDGPLKTVSSSGGQLKQLRSGGVPGGSGQIFPGFLPMAGGSYLRRFSVRVRHPGRVSGSHQLQLGQIFGPGRRDRCLRATRLPLIRKRPEPRSEATR